MLAAILAVLAVGNAVIIDPTPWHCER